MKHLMIFKIAHLILVSAALVGFLSMNPIVGQEANNSESASKFGSDRSVVFKETDKDDLQLYLFIPKSKSESPRPAIVFFFGGGWVGGSPGQFQPHAEYFRSRGMIAVLADYRTRKSHQTSPKECVADGKSAIRYLRKHCKEFGIDPKQIVASGGSAGGHVAAATATLKEYDEEKEDPGISSIPNALVLFNPVYDNGPGQWGHKTVKDHWKSISPANNIRKGMPPAIVFLGDQDKLISVETAKSFQAKMKEVGSKSELFVYEKCGHGFFNFGRNQNKDFINTVTEADRFLVELEFLKGKSTVDEFVKARRRKK